MELKGLKINFLGDSITEGCKVVDSKNRFDNIIASETGAICRNYGVGGTRLTKGRTDSFCIRAKDMDFDTDLIVIFGGTNDFNWGSPIGEMSDRDFVTFYGALHTLLRYVIEQAPDAQVMIITPLHRETEMNIGQGAGCPEKAGILKEYVNAVKEVAEFYSVPVLDFYATSGIITDIPVIREKLIPDGLHPNDEGHKIMAHKMIQFIKSL